MGKFHFFSNIISRLKWASFTIFVRFAPTYTVSPRQRVAVATLDVVLRPTGPSQPPSPFQGVFRSLQSRSLRDFLTAAGHPQTGIFLPDTLALLPASALFGRCAPTYTVAPRQCKSPLLHANFVCICLRPLALLSASAYICDSMQINKR